MPSPPTPPPAPAPPAPPPLPRLFPPETSSSSTQNQRAIPQLNIPITAPPNSTLVSLLIYNGWPFANHWEYFVACPSNPNGNMGVVIQAAGNVREGFWLEVKRGLNLELEGNKPDEKIPLGWVTEDFVSPPEDVFFGIQEGDGSGQVIEGLPRCELERIMFRVPAPEKTLRDAGGDEVDRKKGITQRNCQTWVVESAEQLVKEGIFEQSVVGYLLARKQY